MNSYTNVFGGETINPADLSYKFYALTEDVRLVWPFEALDGERVVADKIDVEAAVGLSIFMPDATLVSVGEDVLWNNVGSNAVTVFSTLGQTIITLQPGTQWYIYLINNDSPGGLWRVSQLGAGTSAADAGTLAGMGLRASGTKLDQNLLTDLARTSGDQTLTAADRAKVMRNTGGVALYSLAAAATLGPTPNDANGWFVIAINAGSGDVTLDPSGAELIDGAPTKVLSPGESCVVYCYGTGFCTMGYGRALATTVSGININAAGSGDFALSAVQIAAQVQDYTGAMTGNRIVTYGPGTGYWFVYNNTTSTGGPWTLSVRGAATDNPPIVIPVNSFTILRSLGGALDIAFTATSGTVTSIATAAGEITGGTPTPITTSGTIGLASTAVTPGTYGTSTHVSRVTVDQKGRVTTAIDQPIAITASQISNLAALLPPGTMIAYGGNPLPPGGLWLPCDGTTRLISAYPALFTVIAGLYGPYTGTTFTLPDTRGSVLMGQDPAPGVRTQAAWFPGGNPATLGSHGGTQATGSTLNIPALGVTVGTYTGNPSYSMSASGPVTGTLRIWGGTIGNTSFFSRGDQGGHMNVPTPDHSHDMDFYVSTANGSTLAAAINSGGASGVTAAANNVGSTTYVSNIPPALIVRHLIKT